MSSKLSTILDKMMTTETILTDSVKSLSQDLSNLTFQNFSMVDAVNPAATGLGNKVSDVQASDGTSYKYLTSSTSGDVVYMCNFTNVKFGDYILCVRMKANYNTAILNILTLKIFNGSTEILSKDIKGTDFARTDNYCLFYTSFNYECLTSEKQPLEFRLVTSNYSGVSVYFDYAYITLITPAVYI